VLPGMIGCYQASETIKIITGFGDILSGILMTIDIRTNIIKTYTIHPVAENKHIRTL
jgi:adenylyltransferase/sulfurtransferase